MYKHSQTWFYQSDCYRHKLLQFRIPSGRAIQCLEIGSFEGLSATYVADNFLEHEDSILVCVDPFSTADTTAPVAETTEGTFLENVSRCKYPSKIRHVKSYSNDFFKTNTLQFDYIYIDGSHLVEDLIVDMNESYKICKPGGYILIDDYLWGQGILKPCIDAFVRDHDDIQIVHCGYQMFVRKMLPKTERFRLGLCMIVKNEAHVVTQVLQCTLPFIDTYCIIDTGSTDDTIQVIRDFYEPTGIKGLVESRPWRDFGSNRSELLDLCGSCGLMDYCLMIDADDLIQHPSLTGPEAREFIQSMLSSLQPDDVEFEFNQPNGFRYSRKQLFKVNVGWHYVGVLHEYPSTEMFKPITARLPSTITMVHRTIGDRSKDPLKFARDAETLHRALEDDPTNVRYMFYLAQSYRDAGNHEEAIKYYKKRFDAGQWVEEVFVSGLNIARLSKDGETKKLWAWKAYEVLPTRVESLFEYLKWVRENNHWKKEALAMGLYALEIKKPSTGLFVEGDIYDWRILDEVSIIAFYLDRKDLTAKLAEQLLRESKMPSHHRARVETNLRLSRKVRVAVYTIALNESKFVKKWLDSCADADYRVIVDTGSTDDTVALARTHGAIVHQITVKPWRFDVARTTALNLLPSDVDFCVTLDMDEVLVPGWKDHLQRAFVKGINRPKFKYFTIPNCSHFYRGDKIHLRHG